MTTTTSVGYLLTAIGSLLPTAVAYRIGNVEDLARQESPPRIIAIPGSETIGASRGSTGDGQRFPRRFLAREVSVEFHVWADDMAKAEDLAELLWNAVQQLAPGSYRPGGARWDGGGITARGVVYVPTVVFFIPISRREQTRELTSLPITGDIITP